MYGHTSRQNRENGRYTVRLRLVWVIGHLTHVSALGVLRCVCEKVEPGLSVVLSPSLGSLFSAIILIFVSAELKCVLLVQLYICMKPQISVCGSFLLYVLLVMASPSFQHQRLVLPEFAFYKRGSIITCVCVCVSLCVYTCVCMCVICVLRITVVCSLSLLHIFHKIRVPQFSYLLDVSVVSNFWLLK